MSALRASPTRGTRAPTVSLEEVFESIQAAGSSRPFLKIDIEGAEYLLLEGLLQRAGSTAGLAIEFHDCGKRLEEIVAFVQRYPLQLVHIHANPCGGFDGSIPRALELTFSSTATSAANTPVLPHALDRPNDGRSEIPLSFA